MLPSVSDLLPRISHRFRHEALRSLLTLACYSELQGHAIKNQDLLIASGAISLKGSESMNALEDDVEAAVRPSLLLLS